MEVWLNPATWTHEQWLVFSILAFVIVAIFVMLHRLYKIIGMARKKPRRPNLRPMGRRHTRTHEED